MLADTESPQDEWVQFRLGTGNLLDDSSEGSWQQTKGKVPESQPCRHAIERTCRNLPPVKVRTLLVLENDVDHDQNELHDSEDRRMDPLLTNGVLRVFNVLVLVNWHNLGVEAEYIHDSVLHARDDFIAWAANLSVQLALVVGLLLEKSNGSIVVEALDPMIGLNAEVGKSMLEVAKIGRIRAVDHNSLRTQLVKVVLQELLESTARDGQEQKVAGRKTFFERNHWDTVE